MVKFSMISRSAALLVSVGAVEENEVVTTTAVPTETVVATTTSDNMPTSDITTTTVRPKKMHHFFQPPDLGCANEYSPVCAQACHPILKGKGKGKGSKGKGNKGRPKGAGKKGPFHHDMEKWGKKEGKGPYHHDMEKWGTKEDRAEDDWAAMKEEWGTKEDRAEDDWAGMKEDRAEDDWAAMKEEWNMTEWAEREWVNIEKPGKLNATDFEWETEWMVKEGGSGAISPGKSRGKSDEWWEEHRGDKDSGREKGLDQKKDWALAMGPDDFDLSKWDDFDKKFFGEHFAMELQQRPDCNATVYSYNKTTSAWSKKVVPGFLKNMTYATACAAQFFGANVSDPQAMCAHDRHFNATSREALPLRGNEDDKILETTTPVLDDNILPDDADDEREVPSKVPTSEERGPYLRGLRGGKRGEKKSSGAHHQKGNSGDKKDRHGDKKQTTHKKKGPFHHHGTKNHAMMPKKVILPNGELITEEAQLKMLPWHFSAEFNTWVNVFDWRHKFALEAYHKNGQHPKLLEREWVKPKADESVADDPVKNGALAAQAENIFTEDDKPKNVATVKEARSSEEGVFRDEMTSSVESSRSKAAEDHSAEDTSGEASRVEYVRVEHVDSTSSESSTPQASGADSNSRVVAVVLVAVLGQVMLL